MAGRYGEIPFGHQFVRNKLVAVGLRPTRQRLGVGHLIFQPGDRHFTAETIYSEARSLA